jgi:formate dehydrogenase major subunit
MEKNPLSSQLKNPVMKIFSGPCDLFAGCDPKYPFVMTTYSSTEHWCTGANTRWQSWLTEAQPQVYVEVSEELAQLRGIKNGEKEG